MNCRCAIKNKIKTGIKLSTVAAETRFQGTIESLETPAVNSHSMARKPWDMVYFSGLEMYNSGAYRSL